MSSPEKQDEVVLQISDIHTIIDQQDSAGEEGERWRMAHEKAVREADEQRKAHQEVIDRLTALHHADLSVKEKLEEDLRASREANRDLELRDNALEERLEARESTRNTTMGRDPGAPEAQTAGASSVETLRIEMEEELRVKEKEIKSLQRDLKAAGKRVDELEQSEYEYKTSRKENNEELQQSIKDKDREIGRLKGDVVQLETKSTTTATSLNQQLKEKEDDIKNISKAYEGKISEAKALQAKVVVLKGKVAQLETDSTNKATSLNERLKEKDIEKKKISEAYKGKIDKAKALEAEIVVLKGKVAQLETNSTNTATLLKERLNEKDVEMKKISEANEGKINDAKVLEAELRGKIVQLETNSANTTTSLNEPLNEKDVEMKNISEAYECKINEVQALEAEIVVLKGEMEKVQNDCQEKVDSYKNELKTLGVQCCYEIRQAYAATIETNEDDARGRARSKTF